MKPAMFCNAILTALLLFAVTAFGATESAEKEMQNAVEAAFKAAKEGPTSVSIADQATIHLPKNYRYIPTTEGRRLMEAMGNIVGDEGFYGLIVPADNPEWFMSVRYESAGYVKDDDAKNWKASELLESITQGTEEANKEREKKGIPAIHVSGWIEEPNYDPTTHRMVWSLASKNVGEDVEGCNYNTLMLGREGYVSMNMVAQRTLIEGLKPKARELLASVTFNEGKRYADFNSSTDKVASYGLAAIVAGAAAKKIGLFAILAGVFAKFSKLIVVGFAAVFGGWFTRFKKKKPVQDGVQQASGSEPEKKMYDGEREIQD